MTPKRRSKAEKKPTLIAVGRLSHTGESWQRLSSQKLTVCMTAANKEREGWPKRRMDKIQRDHIRPLRQWSVVEILYTQGKSK